MPFNENNDSDDESDISIEKILEKYIDYADKRIAEKLGEVASIENLIDLREEFE